MRDSIAEVKHALHTLGKRSPWSHDVKVSDDFLTPLFVKYFDKIGLDNLMDKKNFYELANFVPENEINDEIGEKLDAIAAIHESAVQGDVEPAAP